MPLPSPQVHVTLIALTGVLVSTRTTQGGCVFGIPIRESRSKARRSSSRRCSAASSSCRCSCLSWRRILFRKRCRLSAASCRAASLTRFKFSNSFRRPCFLLLCPHPLSDGLGSGLGLPQEAVFCGMASFSGPHGCQRKAATGAMSRKVASSAGPCPAARGSSGWAARKAKQNTKMRNSMFRHPRRQGCPHYFDSAESKTFALSGFARCEPTSARQVGRHERQ